jgi:hypothetical protein
MLDTCCALLLLPAAEPFLDPDCTALVGGLLPKSLLAGEALREPPGVNAASVAAATAAAAAKGDLWPTGPAASILPATCCAALQLCWGVRAPDPADAPPMGLKPTAAAWVCADARGVGGLLLRPL